ncbi:hypothetical protein GGI24_005570, partial [Coemansia furcata]
ARTLTSCAETRRTPTLASSSSTSWAWISSRSPARSGLTASSRAPTPSRRLGWVAGISTRPSTTPPRT